MLDTFLEGMILVLLQVEMLLIQLNQEQLKIMMEGNQKGLLGMFNVFAGGAVSRMAIFALGIMPYISSSTIVQLLTGVSDYFKNLKAQGEIGRKKITQLTRYGTVLLGTIQGYGLSVGLESSANLVINPGIFFKISTVTTIVAGTIFLISILFICTSKLSCYLYLQ